jgi:hypothetical protein
MTILAALGRSESANPVPAPRVPFGPDAGAGDEVKSSPRTRCSMATRELGQYDGKEGAFPVDRAGVTSTLPGHPLASFPRRAAGFCLPSVSPAWRCGRRETQGPRWRGRKIRPNLGNILELSNDSHWVDTPRARSPSRRRRLAIERTKQCAERSNLQHHASITVRRGIPVVVDVRPGHAVGFATSGLGMSGGEAVTRADAACVATVASV